MKIQLIIELEKRKDFHPFKLEKWKATKGMSERGILVKDRMGRDTREDIAATAGGAEICQRIDELLPYAVTRRRRDFQATAMMEALCARTEVFVPNLRRREWPSERPKAKVFVLHNTEDPTAVEMRDAIVSHECFTSGGVVLVDDFEETAAQDCCVLLLLTRGVLTSNATSRRQLQQVVERTSTDQSDILQRGKNLSLAAQDRTVCVHSKEPRFGWDFDCEEHLTATAQDQNLKAFFEQHEVICYISPDQDSETGDELTGNAHECRATVAHLVDLLEVFAPK